MQSTIHWLPDAENFFLMLWYDMLPLVIGEMINKFMDKKTTAVDFVRH